METVLEFLNQLASKGVKLSAAAGQLNCYAQKGALTPDLRNGIVRHKAEIIALLERNEKKPPVPIETGAARRASEFPLSAGQKGLYILQKLHPEMSAYNVPLCLKITSDVDVDILAAAWRHVLEQFPILTARIVERDGVPYQRQDDDCKTTIQRRAIDVADDDQLAAFIQSRAKAPFDLNRGPLTRIELFSLNNRQSVLLLTVHHIVFDGASAVITMRALLTAYEQLRAGRPVRLTPDLGAYQEFVAWEEAMLASPQGAAHARYWQRQLDGDLPATELLPDWPRPATPTFAGKTLVADLPADLSAWVREFSRAHSMPASAIFLALFQLLLHRYTGQDDIIVGMPVMGRASQRFMAEVGYFINMVPLRAHCGRGITLLEFLRKAQGTMLDALYHSSYPFPLMLDQVKTRHAERSPIFQVSYAYQNFAKPSDVASLMEQGTLQIEGVAGIWQEGEFDLGLEVFEDRASFIVHVKYNPNVYAHGTMQRLFEHYGVLLRAVRENPNQCLHEYPLTSERERHQLSVDFNDTQAAYAREQCIHDLFATQVALDSARVAVVCGEESLTYRELDARSQVLATYLQAQGVEPDSLVALCLPRSLALVVGQLGVLQAGGAYVPLDPEYPDERLAFMLQDSQATVVLTDRAGAARVRACVAPDTVVVPLDDDWPAVFVRSVRPTTSVREEVQPHHLAYVIYTSGSTGQPKGVMVEHRHLANLVGWHQTAFGLQAGDVTTGVAGVGFDAAAWELWPALCVGATVVSPSAAVSRDPDALLAWWARQTIDVSFLPTPLAEVAFARGLRPPRLRRLLVGGDRLRQPPPADAPFAVVNNYGPTECTVVATSGVVDAADPVLHIGRPIANTQIHVLDADRRQVPVGVAGEIYIGGASVARGYWQRPVLTAERFIRDPFAEDPSARLYRTGDRARWRADGTIEYLGRLDTQIKIRGFRIELGEIEGQLNRHPQIHDSAVLAQGPDDQPYLVAFYRAIDSAAEHDTASVSAEDLRAHLARTLPDYMVPVAFVRVAAMPLTPNGKVDRRALARQDVTIGAAAALVPARTATEHRLVAIWSEVLQRAPETLSVEANFFALGGHSLLATQLIAKIRTQFGLELPLKTVFERATIARFADAIATAGTSQVPPLRPMARSAGEPLPLSFAQERLWFLQQLQPESTGYNVPGAVTIHGALDIDALEHAFNVIVARHENLRTVFPSEHGHARQLILDRLDFTLERIDLSQQAPHARETEARRLCQADAATPFDLASGPLIRGKVITLTGHEHILMLNMHHIVSDGWSLGVLIKELGVIMEALRQGQRPVLAPLPIQYADYSVWQRTWLEDGGVLQQQLEYWQKTLTGVPESLDLATDYPRPSVQSFTGDTQAFTLDAQLTAQLKGLAERDGGTLFMVLLAAFKTLLYRYTGQSDLCIGSPIANRQYAETEGLIGMFVNVLALRSQIARDETFVTLLSKVKATCLAAYEHQDAPFEKVVEQVRPQRNLAITPLFQVTVTLQNAELMAADANVQRYPVDSGISKFDLSVEFTETPAGLAGSIDYSTALYTPQTIARMVEHFAALCRAIAITPTAQIRDLEYLDKAERHQLSVEFNDTQAAYAREQCIHDLFAAQVALDGARVAVACGDESLTYRELDARSQALATYLQAQGVEPDSLVALCLPRSLALVVGQLGVLQAGGAYVPLDPEYPDARLAFMLHDSQATVVLTDRAGVARVRASVAPDTVVVALDDEWPAVTTQAMRPTTAVREMVQPHHLAYVIYTSGSTGQPKGVMVEHRHLANLVGWHQAAFGLQAGDVTTGVAGVGFDAAAWELWPALCVGATMVSPSAAVARDPDALLAWWGRQTIDVSFLPTPLAEVAFARGLRPPRLRRLLVGGDRLRQPPPADAPFAVVNNYGPTECTVVATSGVVDAADSVLHIGRPIANTQIHVLDADRRRVPIGVAGEIYIGGASVARGYWRRPVLTAERFIRDPFVDEATEATARLYRTGDRARWRADGTIEYLGRLDTQIKIRGFRIELGEIEGQLNRHPQIHDSAVLAQGPDDQPYLVAFYSAIDAATADDPSVSSEDLCAHLARTLPDYMVPVAFVRVAAMPLTPNGKVDRRALARQDVTIGAAAAMVPARTVTEQRLVAIWSEVLQRAPETLSVEANFFALGGHSLLATQLIAKIRTQFGVELPLKTVFERATIARFAEAIATAGTSQVPPLRPMARFAGEPVPLSFAQERLWFIHQLDPHSARYNVPGAVVLHGALDIDHLDDAFNLILARHESLRTVFPSPDGRAHQHILDRVAFTLQRIDLRDVASPQARDLAARELCHADAATPFDLASGPLIRGKVITLTGHEHILMLNMHHIVSDGWSLGVLIKELGVIMEALRQGQRPVLAPLPIQYADYSVWQRTWLEDGGVLQRQLAYWQDALAGLPESLDLPTDFSRPSVQNFAGATHAFTLDAHLTARLKGLADRDGGTLFMVLLAAFKTLLYRYTGQSDLCIGSPIANRQYAETEGLIGMFVNLLALRSQIDRDETFATLLAKVKATCLAAYEHQDAPFEKVVDLLGAQRNLAISPLFQTTLTLQNVGIGTADQQMQRYPLDNGVSKFDLSIEFSETPAGLAGSIDYSTALYKPQTIARMVDHFLALCQAIVEAPSRRLRDLEYLGAVEKRRLLVDYNDTRADYPRDRCIHELFIDQAARTPHNIAVASGEHTLTYLELHDKCRDLALYLQAARVGPESIVGLCLERSLDMMLGIMGTEQAGGAYMPLDPTYPDDRLAYMLRDSQAPVVLTQERFKDRIRALSGADTEVIALDTQWPDIRARAAHLEAAGVTLRRDVQPHNVSYVIYTSGSTGHPKGVLVEHRALVNRLHWMQKCYPLTPHDVVLQKTPYTFDVSVWEFFWPMMTGCTLVFAMPDGHKDVQYLERLIDKAQITTLHFVPSMLRAFLDLAQAEYRSVTRIFCSGEALDKRSVDEYARRFPNAVLHNLYGPTEAAIDVTAYDCSRLDQPFVPIGTPIDNIQLYVLDDANHPQPIGIAGELHIAGDGLARGYLNRPELTQEKFVANPFHAGTRMYKTGDLARWMDDGNIQYLGRMDTQVKLRGFRIELGEIEARLAEHAGVQDVVVAVREDTPGDKRLAAYVVPDDTCARPVRQLLQMERSGELPRAARYELPNGMVISHQNRGESDFLYKEIFEQQTYLRHGITIDEDACVFDVGANIGLFTLFVRQRTPRATIYAFEPIPPVFESLRINATLAGGEVRLFNCGLASAAGSASFAWFKNNSVISGRYADVREERSTIKTFIEHQHAGSDLSEDALEQLIQETLQHQHFTCQLRTLSEVIAEAGIERIDLLKIDVEKSEMEVFDGIAPADWSKIRQLVVEVHDLDGRLDQVRQLLDAHGFNLTIEQDEQLETTSLYSIYARRPEDTPRTAAPPPLASSQASTLYWSPRQLTTALRAHASATLPDYMVPAAYVWLEKLPLSRNGKLDRKALPKADAHAYASKTYEPPQGEIEEALAEIWQDLLHLPRVGRHDNFFESGGHSLIAVQVMAHINKRFDRVLPLAVMFRAPDIAALATVIASKETAPVDILVPIQRHGDAVPVFGVPGAGGNVLSLQPLSKALGPGQPFFGLQAVGLDGKTTPFTSVEQTAAANIAAMKTVQPIGPYRLVGISYGGIVAYEMASTLLAQGEHVSSLILLDTVAPTTLPDPAPDDEAAEMFDACTAMASLHGATLNIDLARLRQSSSDENVQYVASLLTAHGLEIDGEQFAVFYRVHRANLLCNRAYRPSRLSHAIDVSLYRATQRPQEGSVLSPDYGWNQLLPRPIRIHDVDATHFSILERVGIQGVAAAFNATV
jgi:arthrofactin-type cyclic lipopeptide synthetase C